MIENKFKSVPRSEQLSSYHDKLKGKFCKEVITAIVDPKFENED